MAPYDRRRTRKEDYEIDREHVANVWRGLSETRKRGLLRSLRYFSRKRDECYTSRPCTKADSDLIDQMIGAPVMQSGNPIHEPTIRYPLHAEVGFNAIDKVLAIVERTRKDDQPSK